MFSHVQYPQSRIMTSKYYSIVTYHVKQGDDLGDGTILNQLWNPIFILITILLILFTLFMLALCILMTCSCLRPQFTKFQKLARRHKCCGGRRRSGVSPQSQTRTHFTLSRLWSPRTPP